MSKLFPSDEEDDDQLSSRKETTKGVKSKPVT